jgi:hypothetical protein
MTTRSGVWLLASAALRRPAPVVEPYPHIHDETIPASRTLSGRTAVTLWWRDCAACGGYKRRLSASVSELYSSTPW